MNSKVSDSYIRILLLLLSLALAAWAGETTNNGVMVWSSVMATALFASAFSSGDK